MQEPTCNTAALPCFVSSLRYSLLRRSPPAVVPMERLPKRQGRTPSSPGPVTRVEISPAGGILVDTAKRRSISVEAFKIGGGILLFMLAIEMVFARESGVRSITPGEGEEAHHRGDISVFPLAFPMIAGPGAIATILLAFAAVPFGSVQFLAQLVVIGAVLALTLALMLVTGPVMRVVGVTGGAVLGRLLGVLLAALAAQFVIDGVRAAMA